jgi:exonuclease SbcC
MRPVLLELTGFAAFREPTTVDFEGVDFFALVGPTGSGKSSVIDAMCFALYGSVPRYDDRRVVAPIITMGALEAKVSLTFDVAGERYVATRVVRRTKAGATTPEARLERVGDGEVLAGAAREMEPAVVALLGLPFEHFTKCVVLPQGEFARFLHDKPSDRQELLVELLNLGLYARMGQKARALAAQHDIEVAGDRRRLAELEDNATDERKKALEARLAACATVRAELRNTKPQLEQLTTTADLAEQEMRRAAELIVLLRAVKVPREVTKLAKEQTGAEDALTEAAKRAAEAEAETAQRVEATVAAPDLAILLTVRQAHLDRALVAQELAAALGALAEAEQVELVATEQLEQVEAVNEKALAARESLRTEHRAHSVAQTLRAGEPCPVCRQVVTKVPALRAPAALDRANRDVERAAKELAQLATRREAASTKVATTRLKIEELRRRESELTKRVGERPDPTELDRLIDAVRSGQRAVEIARQAEATARQALEKARTARDTFADRTKKAGAQFRTQRDPLLQHGVDPPALSDELHDDWNALATWARAEVDASEAQALAAKHRRDSVRAERRALLTTLARSCQTIGADIGTDVTIDSLLEVSVRAESDAEHELDRVKAGLAEAKKLRKAVDEIAEEADIARTLAGLLAANRFERWMVAEALDLLVTDASSALQDLSAGQYSFVFDEASRDFLVVDHRNADERRSVRTLSGGETFQASLALALALSDQLGELAANGAARLESIFLDEGFGTLDPDTLDAVASTIENLAVGDRMVGLITHVAELSDRVPVRYVVAKGARTATVDKVLA